MKSLCATFLASIAATLLIGGEPQSHSYTPFTLHFSGYKEVVMMDGNRVVVKNGKGDLVVVALERLSKQEKDYVAKELAARPAPPPQAPAGPGAASRPSLEVTWTKEKFGAGTSSTESAHTFAGSSATNTFLIHFKVRNKSAQPTGDLEVHYQICYSSTDTGNNFGKDMALLNYKVGVLGCPPLAPGASATLETAPFTLVSEDFTSGVGSGHFAHHHKDEFKGVIAVFKSNDVPVFEYVAPGIKKYP